MALKEEREVLTEIDMKNQYEDLLDFTTGEKSFCCSQTEKSSTRKTAQKREKKSYFTCFKFGQSFNQKVKPQVHLRTGKRHFTCQQCGIRYTLKGSWNRHMRIQYSWKP